MQSMGNKIAPGPSEQIESQDHVATATDSTSEHCSISTNVLVHRKTDSQLDSNRGMPLSILVKGKGSENLEDGLLKVENRLSVERGAGWCDDNGIGSGYFVKSSTDSEQCVSIN